METILATDEEALARAMSLLDSGELVVIPGDLVEVLAADALDDDAVERLFAAADRGADLPLTVFVAGAEDLHHVAHGGPLAREWAQKHWPGPATLVLRRRPWLPDAVTAGGEQVKVSAPRQPFTRALAKQFGPLAVCAAGRARGASLRVDAGALPGGRSLLVEIVGTEAKVIRDLGPARS